MSGPEGRGDCVSQKACLCRGIGIYTLVCWPDSVGVCIKHGRDVRERGGGISVLVLYVFLLSMWRGFGTTVCPFFNFVFVSFFFSGAFNLVPFLCSENV